jgi:hypothetical protein
MTFLIIVACIVTPMLIAAFLVDRSDRRHGYTRASSAEIARRTRLGRQTARAQMRDLKRQRGGARAAMRRSQAGRYPGQDEKLPKRGH